MAGTRIPNIGRKFLEEIDHYLRENLATLTCADIHGMYFQFFEDLKAFRGCSTGFTGLSEYLIFRFLYHLLGGAFRQEPVSKDLYRFVSESDSSLRIGQGLPVPVDGSRCYPDIIVYQSDKLVALVEIKIYITSGVNGLRNEIEKLERIKGCHPEMRALLIHYNEISERGRMLSLLRQARDNQPWFDFCVLDAENQLLGEVMQKGLGLKRHMRRDQL